MKSKRPNTPSSKLAAEDNASRLLNVPTVAMAMLMGISAFAMVGAQLGYAQDNPELSLSCLSQRADALSKITDPIQRDQYCVGLSAMGRQLDKAIAPDARIFISGLLGETNASKSGYFFFFRNYLFPRDIEISASTNVICDDEGLEGTPCDSPDQLRAKGFDLLIRCNDNFEFIPLSQKGLPK